MKRFALGPWKIEEPDVPVGALSITSEHMIDWHQAFAEYPKMDYKVTICRVITPEMHHRYIEPKIRGEIQSGYNEYFMLPGAAQLDAINRANAKLIIEAPTMFDALENLANCYDQYLTCDDDKRKYLIKLNHMHMLEVRALLKKITG